MSPYAKAARLLLWLVAFGMMALGLLFLGLELVKHYDHRPGHAEPSVPKIILNAAVLLAGFVLLCLSGKLADKFAKRLDE